MESITFCFCPPLVPGKTAAGRAAGGIRRDRVKPYCVAVERKYLGCTRIERSNALNGRAGLVTLLAPGGVRHDGRAAGGGRR